MATDLNHEIDALLQMMEEIVKIALRIREENNQKKSTTNSKEIEQTSPEKLATQDEVMEKLDDKMKEITNVKGDIAYQINQEDQEQAQDEVIKNEKTTDQVKISSPNIIGDELVEQEKESIIKTFNEMKLRLNQMSKELDQLDFKNPTALARFGQSLIKLDGQIKELGNRITDFIKKIPETAKNNMFSFMVNQLDHLGQNIANLKEKLNEKIAEQTIETEKQVPLQSSELENGQSKEKIAKQSIEAEQTPSPLLKQQKEPVIENNVNTKTTKELLNVMNKGEFYTVKDLILMNVSDNLRTMGDSIEECSQKAIEQNKFIGLKTEIDPNVTSLESMAGNEQAGIKTVASVKDELEDITLSEYGDSMEAAYQNGFDTNPNIATEVTDEEWAGLMENEPEYDPYEPEM